MEREVTQDDLNEIEEICYNDGYEIDDIQDAMTVLADDLVKKMSQDYEPQKLFSKPFNDSDNNLNQSVQEIIDLYSKNNPYLKNINNKNNITIDYPKHYSPTYRTPVYLPSINSNYKKINQSQNKKLNNSTNEGSLLSNIGNKIINEKQSLKREKTQIMILNNENNNENILPQINNITNINIHIYQNGNQNFSINNNIAANRKKMKLKGNIKINNTFNQVKSNSNLPNSISDDFNSNDITKGLNKNANLSTRFAGKPFLEISLSFK